MDIRPHHLALVALLGLAPVAYYVLGRGATPAALALVNVVLIAGSLVVMLGARERSTASH
ncbi:MAG: hypothetical protein ABEJ89_05355 [Haloarculaceae archaeon]